MRKAILIALVSGLSMLIGGLKVAAAVYSNASVAGTWVCAGNGFHQGKDQKSAIEWVPDLFVGWYTLDGKGKFASVRETDNSAGMSCSNTIGQGANSYSVSSDGSASFTLSESSSGSNPSQCPASVTAHSNGVFQSATSLYAVPTDSGVSGWFICTKRRTK